jgi:uncharacterized protein (DUF433 family)
MAQHARIAEIVIDPVSMILFWMSEGWSQEKILAEYPNLDHDDLAAGLRFAAGQLSSMGVAAE